MIDLTALKSMGRETKALVLILEFQARRMPMFQMRELFELLATNQDEKIQIADLVGKNLVSRGFPEDQVKAFLNDLRANGPSFSETEESLENTRRMRLPFTQSFERPAPVPEKPLAGMVSDGTSFISRKPSNPDMPSVKVPPLMGTVAEGTSFIARKPSSPALPSVSVPPVALPQIPPPRPKSSAVLPIVPTPGATESGLRRKTKFIFDTGAPPLPTPPKGLPSVNPPAAAMPMMPPPAAAAPMISPPSAAPEPPAEPEPETDRRPLVVLAEDDRRARMIFKLRLEEHGFRVIECGDGIEAWEHIQVGGIEAAVLDMKMPGMHGLEILKNMTQQKMTLPVVVCSAYDQLEDEFVVQTYPKLRYLVKPIAPETIVMALRELLYQKPA